MCGIIAVLRRRTDRAHRAPDDIVDRIDAAVALLDGAGDLRTRLSDAAEVLHAVDADLRGVAGVRTLLDDPDGRILHAIGVAASRLGIIDETIEDVLVELSDEETEATNSSLISVKDAVWAIERDRIRAAEQVVSLAGPSPSPSAIGGFFSLHQALSALDRLEVRGRDSAGIELLVAGHGLDLDDPSMTALLHEREDPMFTSGAVRRAGASLAFVYKASAEIGELGDNTEVLRNAVRSDELLRLALSGPDAEALVLGHTRWASVGIISEPNAHPQSSEEMSHSSAPFVTAVLNGDVDNFADLIAAEDLEIPTLITTDAKVIPALVSRRLARGVRSSDAFRDTVATLEGSVAVAASEGEDPTRLRLALRGSGQALYIGMAEDCFIVASEPYGVVEDTATYFRMDGETPADPDNPTGSRGQIIELDATRAGDLSGVRRWSYDGSELAVGPDDLATAQITTRDIDRGDFPHFLLKEITDAPGSFRKTLRGKLVERDGRLAVALGPSTMPRSIRADLASGTIDRVLVIGQGTAAVAGQSLALALSELVADTPVRVEALPATELSGFRLRPDMGDTLIVAISQSGTTTDTNRTVDLARGRGARVIAIVNRRSSDLCDKADGVLYTSDGRDVEMSVASTKAFYAQIAAGWLLALGIAAGIDGAASIDDGPQQRLLTALRELPELMEETLSRRDEIAAAARQFAPSRRYWALVGNGPNQIAARELRIKLSELCYKSIACDATEDKKHIDLSAEPMILVCAAGLVGSTADDVGKEVAIYRAHKAAPIVIATDGNAPAAALAVISVPHTDPRLAFVLSAMAGHIFGYEAALAIDAQAVPLREARAAIERLISSDDAGDQSGEWLLGQLRSELTQISSVFSDAVRSGAYNGHLEAGTAVRVAAMFRYATGLSPLSSYQAEFGKVGTPGVILDDLAAALTAGIEELTRPIDAIKHQAKTVTVGISRSDESLLNVPLVAATLAAGAPRDRLAYATLRSLGELDPAVLEVVGSTRYRVDRVATEEASAVVVDRSGISQNLGSRTERDPRLRGTKQLVAREQVLMVARGRSDGRTVVIIPETKDGETTGLTLLHLRLADRLPPATARTVLQGYRDRYQSLREHVTETEDVFREDLLGEESVLDLLTEPILDLADRWRQ